MDFEEILGLAPRLLMILGRALVHDELRFFDPSLFSSKFNPVKIHKFYLRWYDLKSKPSSQLPTGSGRLFERSMEIRPSLCNNCSRFAYARATR